MADALHLSPEQEHVRIGFSLETPETAADCKKRKIQGSDIFETLFQNSSLYNGFLRAYLKVMEATKHSLLPSIITSCDAQVVTRLGIPFSTCTCEAKSVMGIQFPLGAFFGNAVNIYNFLSKKKVPDDRTLMEVVKRLLGFIMDKSHDDGIEELKKIGDKDYVSRETQVMVTLAEHFFSRLSIPKDYVIDQQSDKAVICKCGKCSVKNLEFGDTTIGNQRVWHGPVDILFDSCEVAVTAHVEDNEDEVKTENLGNLQLRSQVIAQTIVFSLLQKKRHPLVDNFIIPNIVANAAGIKIFFYDAKNDILLESCTYPFFYYDNELETKELVFETVIASWLVLNYKYLCTGPFKEYVQETPKSMFREFAKEALPIYESGLKLRNVISDERPPKPFEDWEFLENKYSVDWPASLPFRCDKD